ncbi:MAG: hypothetical protein ACE14P_04695 [Methanotrichaceae archaeon]
MAGQPQYEAFIGRRAIWERTFVPDESVALLNATLISEVFFNSQSLQSSASDCDIRINTKKLQTDAILIVLPLSPIYWFTLPKSRVFLIHINLSNYLKCV